MQSRRLSVVSHARSVAFLFHAKVNRVNLIDRPRFSESLKKIENRQSRMHGKDKGNDDDDRVQSQWIDTMSNYPERETERTENQQNNMRERKHGGNVCRSEHRKNSGSNIQN